jgi:transposase
MPSVKIERLQKVSVKSEHLSTKSEHSKDSKVDWRRNKVLELSSQGYSQRDIASTLQVGLGTVNKDAIKFVQTNKERLAMSTKEDNGRKKSKEPDYERQGTIRRRAGRGNRRT